MRGEFLPIWSETWGGIWSPLAKHAGAPRDLFSELYRELASAFVLAPSPERLAEIAANPAKGRATFRQVKADGLQGERAVVEFLERAHGVVDDLGGDALANRYFILVEAFLSKFSLRYDLRRPFALNPTLSGVFAGLIRELKAVTLRDPHFHSLMVDFEESLRDLSKDSSSRRIRICIQKQVNLLEALGQNSPGVAANTLGAICDQVGSWPHDKIKEAVKALYKFTCSYPGIRHGGTPATALRNIEIKDMVAMTVVLAGITPYLAHQLDSDIAYRGQ